MKTTASIKCESDDGVVACATKHRSQLRQPQPPVPFFHLLVMWPTPWPPYPPHVLSMQACTTELTLACSHEVN